MIKRIGLLIGCGLLLALSWIAVLKMQTPLQKQTELIALADAEIAKGTYANAEPYLTEAVGYNTGYTLAAMDKLKNVYLNLGLTQEYLKVLKNQTARTDCGEEAYSELAEYHIEQNKIVEALDVLKLGIERTNSEKLINFYEQERYAFDVGSNAYEDVTAYHSGGIQVKLDGLWGLANGTGQLIIPCSYEQISSYDTVNGGCAVVLQTDKKVTALNLKNQAVAILDTGIEQIGNLSQNIIPLQLASGKWIIADSKLVFGDTEYEDIRTVYNSAVAVKKDGSWGVITLDGETIAPYEYDGIITDELGRCYAQNAVFAKKGSEVYLSVNGEQLPETYEDARPFADDGWAAVKKNGKWGYIDTAGELKIDYQFEDALSFSQNLAAVKLRSQTETDGELEFWGYINTQGSIAIEPAFYKAKNFAGGSAPVLTELGWQFISLLEYS